MKKLLLLILFVGSILVSCKKDKENSPSLKGKWIVDNNLYKECIGGTLSNTYTEPGAGATMDFQDNGHLVINYPDNHVESMSYTIKPDSKVDIDGDVFEIRSLTSSGVTLFLHQDYSPGDYDEVYINLKR